jgi:hypothetical protein
MPCAGWVRTLRHHLVADLIESPGKRPSILIGIIDESGGARIAMTHGCVQELVDSLAVWPESQ